VPLRRLSFPFLLSAIFFIVMNPFLIPQLQECVRPILAEQEFHFKHVTAGRIGSISAIVCAPIRLTNWYNNPRPGARPMLSNVLITFLIIVLLFGLLSVRSVYNFIRSHEHKIDSMSKIFSVFGIFSILFAAIAFI
jgi:nitrate/nitrite transporter NarK